MTVLLLSGGLASACVAAWRRPERCLFVDYGQVAAASARSASGAIADGLALPWSELSIDCSPVKAPGSERLGLVAGSPVGRWPYRNQLLITLAAAWAQPRGQRAIMFGVRRADGLTDEDATPDESHLFFRRADQLLRMQPGRLRISLPALGMTLGELVALSGVTPDLLARTYACEVASVPCSLCDDCRARAMVIRGTVSTGLTAAMRGR